MRRALGILDASSDAVLAVAPDGSVAAANAMAAEVFAAPTAVLVGQPADLLVPQLASVVRTLKDRRHAGDLTAGPAGEGSDLSAIRLDGTRFPASVWVTPLRTRRGLLVAATVRDLTRRHETRRPRWSTTRPGPRSTGTSPVRCWPPSRRWPSS